MSFGLAPQTRSPLNTARLKNIVGWVEVRNPTKKVFDVGLRCRLTQPTGASSFNLLVNLSIYIPPLKSRVFSFSKIELKKERKFHCLLPFLFPCLSTKSSDVIYKFTSPNF